GGGGHGELGRDVDRRRVPDASAGAVIRILVRVQRVAEGEVPVLAVVRVLVVRRNADGDRVEPARGQRHGSEGDRGRAPPGRQGRNGHRIREGLSPGDVQGNR